jgi:hypothetical protein
MIKLLQRIFYFLLLLGVLGCTTKNITEVTNPTYNTVVNNQAIVYSVASKYFCPFCGIYHGYKMAEFIDANGISVIPTVSLNDDTLPIYDLYPTDIVYLDENTEMPYGESYQLKVSSEHGLSSASLVYPDSFNLVSPAFGSTVNITNLDKNIPLVWRKSNGAEWYYVFYSIDISYIDTLGIYYYIYEYSSDAVTDTSLTISLEELFGSRLSSIDSIMYGYGQYQVMACSGPVLEPGSVGNIRGADKGFYWLRYGLSPVYFSINSTPKNYLATKELSPHISDSLWWEKAKALGYVPNTNKNGYFDFNFCNK